MASTSDRILSLLTELALATDGALAGVTLALGAIQAYITYKHHSSALDKIRHAKPLPISDLRSLLDDSQPGERERELIIVRGVVEAKSALDRNWPGMKPSVLVSHNSGDEGVVLQKTQTCIYNDAKGLFRWTASLGTILGKSWKNPKSTSIRTIPFVLLGSDGSQSAYVVVNLEGATQPLPLMTVYHHLQPVPTSPYTFLQAISGHAYPVGLLDEEKMLTLGKEISAVGTCSLQDGNPQIEACEDLPYFLSDMTKDQMLEDLTDRTNNLYWCGILLGSLSVGILSYAFAKNWRRWKEWIDQRRIRRLRRTEIADIDPTIDDHVDEENEQVPDGQLCVICLSRRKRSAFVPCGHFVCCHRCALSVERDAAPKCPLCRQTIRTSVRIYDS